jgi:hypothetical protein
MMNKKASEGAEELDNLYLIEILASFRFQAGCPIADQLSR